ncbi:hypothetical protein PTI98_002333 [Pleurotus ostreatus]|nr:hypothetical protein PTI98_002333 [Pleurotus ostreatus]
MSLHLLTLITPAMPPQVLQNIYTIPIKSLQRELGAYLLGLVISSPWVSTITDSQHSSPLLILAYRLYTISICQVVLYFRTYRLDPCYLKRTVLVLIFMDSARFVFLAHTVYTSFVTLNDVLHHVDRQVTCHENLIRQITLMMVEFLGTSLCCVVQSAYVTRIFHLSNRNKLLVGMIMLPTLCQFLSGLAAIGGL